MTTTDVWIRGPDQFGFDLAGGLGGDPVAALTVVERAAEEGRARITSEVAYAKAVVRGDVVLAILDRVRSPRSAGSGSTGEVLDKAAVQAAVDPEGDYYFTFVEF